MYSKLELAARSKGFLFIFCIINALDINALGTISDLVWNDSNANGIIERTELGINGVKVSLYSDADQNGTPDGPAIRTSYTTYGTYGSGNYYFDNLTPGFYIIHFQLPSYYFFTQYKVSGTNDNFDSDANPTTGYSRTIEIKQDENISTIDAGMHRNASLGDFVWFDKNKNGIQDSGEPGINNVSISLYSNTNNLIGTAVSQNNPNTGAPGYYKFPSISPGKYYIKLSNLPSGYGYKSTTANASTDDIDSDIDQSNGINTSAIYDIIGANDYSTIDAGLIYNQSIGNKIWNDQNRNGIQDINEVGINDVLVSLYNQQTKQLITSSYTQTSPTGIKGYYNFDNLLPQSYYITVELPPHYYVSPSDQTIDTKDSDINHANGINSSATIILTENMNNTSISAGMYLAFKLGNYVWNDNGAGSQYYNGIQDNGELPEANVKVYLKNTSNLILDSMITDINGKFEFLVDQGNYYLEFKIPSNKTFTIANQLNESIDSDVTGAFGQGTTAIINVGPNTDMMDVDAGIAPAEILAIDDLHFWAQYNDPYVILNWSTQMASRIHKIILEKASDADPEFAAIYETENNNQKYTDYLNKTATTYYRLQIIEHDGSITWSKIITVDPTKQLLNYKAYFNMKKLIIETKKSQIQDLQVNMHNITGQLIWSKQIKHNPSAAIIELDADDLPSGTYLININDGVKENTIKLIHQ